MRLGFTGRAAWWVQRASAVYMLLFLLLVLTSFSLQPIHGFAEWKARVGGPGSATASIAFLAALLSHLWVGLRDVLLDYAQPPRQQRLLLGAVAAALFAIAAWALWILTQAQH